MIKIFFTVAVLLITANTYMESPDEFLARGFDIRDGKL